MTREEAISKLNELIECTVDRGMIDDICYEVIEFLEAQEPRVMTMEEAKSAYVVEYRSGKMCEVGSRLLDLNVDPLNVEYGKIYRVWTSRPDEKMREETPWDG